MPAAPSHAMLALNALIAEIDSLGKRHAARMKAVAPTVTPSVEAARADAMAVLEAADRLDLFEAASERLAAACMRRRIPKPARAAAYSALLGLIANDLLPPPTFRTLYEAWEQGLDGRASSPVIVRGEEVVLHIE